MEEFPQTRNLSLIVVALVDEEVVNMVGLAVKKLPKITLRRDLKELQAYIVKLYRC